MRALSLVTSLRTALVLLCLLVLLLFLNVVLPQEGVVGKEAFDRLVESNPVARFLLVTLGLGNMATSPVFLAGLGLFFVNLTAVLLVRLKPTWRRTRPRPRSEAGLQAWTKTEGALITTLPAGWSLATVTETLMEFGYRARRVGETTVWGVRHRTAPLGFLLFHVSFLLILAGAVFLYYTRFVGVVVVAEGQQFAGGYREVLRYPPFGLEPALQFTVVDVEPRVVEGRPLHLGATFRFSQGRGSVERRGRINHPARWGSTALLLQRAGLAPIFWLQDAEGFTLDRVAVNASDDGTHVPLANGQFDLFLAPRGAADPFPSVEELPTQSMEVQVLSDGRLLFDGVLRPGGTAPLGTAGQLVLEELRYWVAILVVSERGGWLLIGGFLLAVAGLVWRLLWFRREVAVTWNDRELRLVGHSEYYAWRFREELEELLEALQKSGRTGLASHQESSMPRGRKQPEEGSEK